MLSWDAAGRLAAWQNAPTSPTTTDTFLSDGSGERLEQQVTSGGTTTTTRYIGALAQYIVAGTTSWQKYYSFAGRLVAGDNGHWHELLQDQLGTTQVQLNASGAGESGSLRNPYGSTRYGSSAFLGDLGYTGQRKDQTSDLTYFQARYYDQDVGVFVSADTTLAGGLNRYAYVKGNPETATDPTGHCPWCIGLIVGAIVGAGIAYGAQVYHNTQNGVTGWSALTTNINGGDILAGAAAGAFVGGTLGAGAAGAILAGGGTAAEAAGAGAYSAALFAGYGVGLSVGGGVAADELDEDVVSRAILNDASSSGSSATGTVWDRITPRGPTMSGTEIPDGFDLDTEMGRFRVIGNATKHMQRYVASSTESGYKPYALPSSAFSAKLRSQIMLDNFASSVDTAVQSGLQAGTDNFGEWGDWEFGIGTQNMHIYHALIRSLQWVDRRSACLSMLSRSYER